MTKRQKRKNSIYFTSRYETIPLHWCIEWDMTRLKLKASGYPLDKIKLTDWKERQTNEKQI